MMRLEHALTRGEVRAIYDRVAAIETKLAGGADVSLDCWCLLADVEIPLLLHEVAAVADAVPSTTAQFLVVRAIALKNRVERKVKPAVAVGTTPDAGVRAEVREAVTGLRQIVERVFEEPAPGTGPEPAPTATSDTTALCHAITTRSILSFDYDGHARLVAPYCHGVSTRGVELLRAVQLAGWPGKGFGFGKLWAVAKLQNMRTTGERFVPDDPNYNPDDSAMRKIHCRLVRSRGSQP